VYKIVDNLNNYAEAEDLDAAATAAKTFFTDNEEQVNAVVITRVLSAEEVEDQLQSITAEYREQLKGMEGRI